MALIKSVLKDEIRIIFMLVPRFVDSTVIEQCYREIMDLLEKTEESHVLIHFGRVDFMSSSALGMLIRVRKKCEEFKITLKLSNISPNISEVFKITGLNKVFDIRADAADAIEVFKAGGNLGSHTKRQIRHELK